MKLQNLCTKMIHKSESTTDLWKKNPEIKAKLKKTNEGLNSQYRSCHESLVKILKTFGVCLSLMKLIQMNNLKN